MGESCGRNGSTILASGGLPLVLAGGNLLWLQAVHRLLRCCGNKPEQEGDLLWRQLPIRFFNFSVNGPPDTTLTWAEGTPGGVQFTFRLLDPSGAPIDLGQTRQRDSIL